MVEKTGYTGIRRETASLTVFKYNRSKIYVGTETKPEYTSYIYISDINCYVSIAEPWLQLEKVEFINGT